MNIILISDDRLKVVLTDRDLSGYGIRIEDIDYGNTETKRVFWTILDKAKNETGFDAALSRIFIQIYPDSRGGCEMYVSRIGDKKSSRSRTDGVRCAIGGESDGETVEYVYRFGGLDALISACRILVSSGFRGFSSAYACGMEPDSEFYLIIKVALEDEERMVLYLAEYGESYVSRYGKWRLMEHCRLISEGDAVSILGNL